MMVLSGSSQKKVGIQNPVFRKETMPDIEKGLGMLVKPNCFLYLCTRNISLVGMQQSNHTRSISKL